MLSSILGWILGPLNRLFWKIRLLRFSISFQYDMEPLWGPPLPKKKDLRTLDRNDQPHGGDHEKSGVTPNEPPA